MRAGDAGMAGLVSLGGEQLNERQGMIERGSLPSDGRLPTERELSESMGIGRRAVRSGRRSGPSANG